LEAAGRAPRGGEEDRARPRPREARHARQALRRQARRGAEDADSRSGRPHDTGNITSRSRSGTKNKAVFRGRRFGFVGGGDLPPPPSAKERHPPAAAGGRGRGEGAFCGGSVVALELPWGDPVARVSSSVCYKWGGC
jgi:hypothetical protein